MCCATDLGIPDDGKRARCKQAPQVAVALLRQLFIDGLGGFEAIALRPERLTPFLTALANEFRTLGVTTICTVETPTLFGPVIETPMPAAAAIADNLIVLRFVELHAHLHRLLSVVKVRGGGFDSALREFRVARGGLTLADTFESTEAITTGVPREREGGRATVKPAGSRSRK
jgi:circadian clock protein KaiC